VDNSNIQGYIVIEKVKLRVFIADDSAYIRERLPEILAGIPGIDLVGTAERGDNLVEVVNILNPDVVILDIRMPGKSGIEILKEIKQTKPEIKVIILTSYPYPQYRKKCMNLRASYFFEKTADFEKLVSALKQMVTEVNGSNDMTVS
jgi:DNA-binding NarL/FixJ family response regulator